MAAHFRKKQILQEMCAMLGHLREAVDREDRACEAVSARHPDYALARALCQESKQHLRLLAGAGVAGRDHVPSAIDHVPSAIVPVSDEARVDAEQMMYIKMPVEVGRDVLDRLAALEQRVEVKVKDGLKEVCKALDPHSFQVIFKAYLGERQMQELGEELGRYMLVGIDAGIKNVLFSSLAAHADQDGLAVEDLHGLAAEGLAANLRPSRVLPALLSCLQLVCQQLVSLQV